MSKSDKRGTVLPFRKRRSNRRITKFHAQVATRIRNQRQRKGITITRLAKVTGIDRGYLGEIERGAKNLRLLTILRIVNSLDTTVAELLRGIPA